MKGIILTGGSGTRLYPSTIAISKQLIPIYDKPMIYYPLSTLMLAGIREILLISNPHNIGFYKELFNNGSQIGLSINYESQEKPRGLADAFIVGEEFIGNDQVALILGDNVFYGENLTQILRDASSEKEGAVIFGYPVKNPSSFGVVEFDNDGNVISLDEKPKRPKSNYAIPGLYFYDNNVIEYAKSLDSSHRGELEITDVNQMYHQNNRLKVKIFSRGMAWFDTGTHESLLEASTFVHAIQKRQGFYIACIEEIAYRLGYITSDQLRKLSKKFIKTDYGKYLVNISHDKDEYGSHKYNT